MVSIGDQPSFTATIGDRLNKFAGTNTRLDEMGQFVLVRNDV